MNDQQQDKSRLSLWISCLSSLIATGVHFYLTLHYYQLKAGVLTGQSACNINSTFNCDIVSLSSYAQIFNIPIALLGFLTALITTFFIIIYQWNLIIDRRLVAKTIFSLSTITLISSLIMGTVSITLLNTYCLFCIITYALSIITFIGIWRGLDGHIIPSINDLPSFFGSQRWISIIVLLIPIGGFLGNQMFRKHHKLDKIEEFLAEALSIWHANPSQNFSPKGLSSNKSSQKPFMTIVEFADFKCGHCQMAAPIFKKFKEKHPDVQFIFKSYALDGTCNPEIKDRDGNPYIGDGTKCLLAQLTYCADKQNKGWEFHDWIFEQSKNLYSKTEIENLATSFAEKQQIKSSDLISCMNSQESFDAIKEQIKEGSEAGVAGTPTVFINGRKIPGGQNPLILESLYRELKK